MENFILLAFLWIAPHVGIDADEAVKIPLPVIVSTKQEYINSRATPGAIAFYDEINAPNRIYLSKDIDLMSYYGRSILLHELVHYVQFTKKTEHHTCAAKYETTAYNLQNKWLAELDQPAVMSPEKIKFLSYCFRHIDK